MLRENSPLFSDEVRTYNPAISSNAAGTLNEVEMNEHPDVTPPSNGEHYSEVARKLFAALLANVGSQLLARRHLISLRITSGGAITWTAILNEKEPRRRASGL